MVRSLERKGWIDDVTGWCRKDIIYPGDGGIAHFMEHEAEAVQLAVEKAYDQGASDMRRRAARLMRLCSEAPLATDADRQTWVEAAEGIERLPLTPEESAS